MNNKNNSNPVKAGNNNKVKNGINKANNANNANNANKPVKVNTSANNKLNSNINKINKNQSDILNSAAELLNDNTNTNSINNNIAKLQANIELMDNNQEPFYIRYKKLLIGIAVLVGLILLYLGGRYVYNLFFDKSIIEKQIYYLENIASTSENKISNEEIVEARNGFDYSIAFWVYIDDFYENHTKWRHMFHKGTHNSGSQNVIDYDEWDNLTATYREQSPGCWLHPGLPKIRYALTIQPNKEYCGIFHTRQLCENDNHHYCSWDGTKCNLKKEHLEQIYKDEPIDYMDTNNGDHILQYVDIDIPVKQASHLAFVLNQKVLNIFQDGKLIQTAKFMGDPLINRSDLHIALKNNFSGNLLHWTYFPDSISDEKVKELASNLPDFEKIPVKKRANNKLKNGEFAGAIKTLF
jgi:hypothetical protein